MDVGGVAKCSDKESFGVAGCACCEVTLLVNVVKVDLGNTIIAVCSHFSIFASFLKSFGRVTNFAPRELH